MNAPRIIFSILGLACVLLFYFTRFDVFLLIAVVSFILGLLLMGAFRRSPKAPKKTTQKKERK